MGLSERCDALVIAISEERGSVTLFQEGTARPMAGAEELVRELERLPRPPTKGRPAVSRLLTDNPWPVAPRPGVADASGVGRE